ncbi:MAG TPA: TIGR03986 family CRISPR-associated RAMP protein [Anaerolineae bacterium]|nr:TIGR03986 family CRISPR-associated RAMP protein [Anaerolineae bacterium]
MRPVGAKPQTSRQTQTKVQAGNQKYRFLNPYNFVRYLEQPRPQNHVLGNCPPPPHDRYVGLSGRITCKVEAITPLFISDSHAVEGKEGDHRTYRFFQLDGQPALPASSLRGMFRSVFEAMTNSCFVAFDEDTLSYHLESSRSPWLVPARVEREDETWHLRLLPGTTNLQIESSGRKNPVSQEQLADRQSFIERTDKPFRNPDGITHGEEAYALLRWFQHPHPRISFWDVVEIRRESSSLPRPRNSDERIERGWLCVTNQNIEPKHSERFFFRAQENHTGPELIELPEKVQQDYEALIKDYQERHRDAVQKRRRKNQPPGQPVGEEAGFSRFVYQAEEQKLKGGELVYAMLEGSTSAPRVKFIAPVSVPRVGYEHSVGQLLPDFLHRCKDYNALCPACRVFGWVREGAEDIERDVSAAYTGRVRLSHGTLTHSAGELPDTPLAILSTPKPTTTAFYLLNSEGQPDAAMNYDTDDARLRGRKFYRHHGRVNPDEYQRGEKSEQNRTVKGALKPGATFTFTLDFENLAPLELGALLYTLELKEGMFHRLGYAKPLGFGSVKVTVESVQTLDWEVRLQSIEPETGWQSIDGAQLKQKFLEEMQRLYVDGFAQILDDLYALLGMPPKLPIHSPRPTKRFDPDHPQFEWFMGNKRRAEKRGKDLPEAVALELSAGDTTGLPLIEKDGKERQG